MKTKHTVLCGLLVLLTVSLAAGPAAATNGMYLVAYGAETAGRGGVNLAIADRTLALNSNPAGISQLQGNHASVGLSILAPALDYENLANPTFDGEDRYFPLPAFAYIRAGKETPWSWGVGFLAQGGMGATFNSMNTFFGTVDETYTEVRFGTLTPTVSYAVNEDMAFGLSLSIGYADASFRFFPETSYFNVENPAFSFFGVDMEQAGGLQTNVRVGWWWRPRPRFSVGAVYQTKTNSTFEDGSMRINFGAHPFLQQKVLYTADMDGFTFAAQAGVGFAVHATNKLQVALDVKRYFWDDAIDTILVTAHDPQTAGAPSEVTLPFVFNWKDQWVLALGMDYRWNDKLTMRWGYNFGENPVPNETLTPLFPATVEHHLTVGFSFLKNHRVWEFAVERAFGAEEVNLNSDPMVNPFAPGSVVGHEQWTVSFGMSWSWARNGKG